MNAYTVIDAARKLVLLLMLAFPLTATAAEQSTYAKPEEAIDALMSALKANDDAAMLAVFGEDHKSLVVTPDRAFNSARRAEVLRLMQLFHKLEVTGTGRRTLYIGDQAWPVPIPLVHGEGRWRFATEEGEDEIVNRRIGANEYNAIAVMRAYLDAQRQYASRDRNGDGVLEYARKLGSTPGQHDGLYWDSDANGNDEESRLGPLIAESAAYFEGHAPGDAYRGYYFRILDRQGESAPGGSYSYIINGRMIAGFAMAAYPAVYGESGVKTFIVSNNGAIYERDLGEDTGKLGAAITTFDPGPGWDLVASSPVASAGAR